MEGYAPIFEILIDEESENSGFIRNSFVKNPAVHYEYFTFNQEEKSFKFASDEKEQVFTSISILADTPIKRVTEDGQVFYVVFSKDVIRKIRNKLVKDGRSNDVSLYHDKSKIVDGVYMVENFILNKGRVESPLFEGAPDGSLVTSYWVEDKKRYEELLADENFRGFSIEINAKISQIFSSSFESLYIKEMNKQRIQEILFSDKLTKEQKKENLAKVLNIK